MPGTRFGSTYVVEELLGAGAYGEVYRVTHRYLGAQAIKVFPPDTLDPNRDFFREARLLVELTHPNIVRVFDANVIDTPLGELTYLAMEYIKGETLGQLLRRRVRLPLAEAISLAEGLCSGLGEAHRLEPPLLHLDLTVKNVLVTVREGQISGKIADFGVAGHVHPVTRMARARGEFFFMAPEMFWGYATTASDVYSLAFLIYWLYAGVPPYPYPDLPPEATRDDWINAVRQCRQSSPSPLERFRKDVPSATVAALQQALAPKPDDRFLDVPAFHAALRLRSSGSG
jgi:serine/threonine-protein kinase